MVSLLFNIAKPCDHTGICLYCIVQHTHAFDMNHVMPTIFIAFLSAMFSVLRSLLNAKAVGWVISDTMQPSCTWVQRWWGHTSSGNCLTLPRVTLPVASIILSTYQDVAKSRCLWVCSTVTLFHLRLLPSVESEVQTNWILPLRFADLQSAMQTVWPWNRPPIPARLLLISLA